MPSSKKSASRYTELAESRRRFAAAVFRAEKPVQSQCNGIQAHVTGVVPSSLPPNYTLSAEAAEMLVDS